MVRTVANQKKYRIKAIRCQGYWLLVTGHWFLASGSQLQGLSNSESAFAKAMADKCGMRKTKHKRVAGVRGQDKEFRN